MQIYNKDFKALNTLANVLLGVVNILNAYLKNLDEKYLNFKVGCTI